jgi:hypothetical protein
MPLSKSDYVNALLGKTVCTKYILTACAASSIITTSKARVILLKMAEPLKLRVENTYEFSLAMRITFSNTLVNIDNNRCAYNSCFIKN